MPRFVELRHPDRQTSTSEVHISAAQLDRFGNAQAGCGDQSVKGLERRGSKPAFRIETACRCEQRQDLVFRVDMGRGPERGLAEYQIGRASRRERVCQYVYISVVAVT